jgi:hypothetical protein
VAEELADAGGGLGAGEQVALGVVAAELVERCPLAGDARVTGIRQVPAACSRSRSSTRRILPEMVLGRSAVNSISRGYL